MKKDNEFVHEVLGHIFQDTIEYNFLEEASKYLNDCKKGLRSKLSESLRPNVCVTTSSTDVRIKSVE